MRYVSIFAVVKLKFNRLPGLTRYLVVAMLFLAMFTSLTSYTFFEQSHCTSIECELDVDLNEVDNTKFDADHNCSLDFVSVEWFQFSSIESIEIQLQNQEHLVNSFPMVKRYLAFHSLKVFC
jgi:hypothetical protein